jgi:hypothetical protein
MARTFGVEIEAKGLSFDQVCAAVRTAGFDCRDSGYSHVTTPYWKVVRDASVRGASPFELVSPILSGEAGLDQLRKVVSAIYGAGATVESDCGLHVHIGASDLTFTAIKTLIQRFANFESDWDRIIARSRRGNLNPFCRSVRERVNAAPSAFNLATNVNDLGANVFGIRSWRDHLDSGRYYKLNLHPYVTRGTIEFRLHGGTVNATKICNWVSLILEFVEESRRRATNVAPAPAPAPATPAAPAIPVSDQARAEMLSAARAMLRSGSRRAMFDCLLQSNGVSVADLMAAAGWTAPHSIRAEIARTFRGRLQLPITTHTCRSSGQLRYSINRGALGNGESVAARPAAPASLAAPQAADSMWAGISPALTRYYSERAAQLA